MTAPVITIDGPSGSGKGTLCQALSRELGWHLLDSGALYRLVGLAAEKHGVTLDYAAGLADLALALDVAFIPGEAGQPTRVLLEGEDVGVTLRTEHTGHLASQVAVVPAVRDALLQRQRDFAQSPGLVADGRDMGTVVFPEAGLKVFLTASAEARAERRYKQLKDKGEKVKIGALLKEIEARDARDSQREVAPLKPADGALILDSTDLGIEEVYQRVLAEARARFVAS